MNELVLDASVLVKWFKTAGEQELQPALRLLSRFRQGSLLVVAPPLVFLELLNAAARHWGWEAQRLERFAADLDRLGLVVQQPAIGLIARWTARGLTAYDACYVALAEARHTVVVTADQQMLTLAPAYTHALAAAEELP